MQDEERNDRQILLFGHKGQDRIGAMSVTVVGLGGLGSHVTQQLAYLGVKQYFLVDDDKVTKSSLNRLIGADPEDAIAQRSKVEVAGRMIRKILPGARTEEIRRRVEAHEARAAVQGADLVFGCLDSDASRLALADLCAQYKRPYFDLATDVSDSQGQLWYGGRVLFCEPGKRCLVCMGLLDQRELARASMTAEQLAEDGRLYSVPHAALSQAGPSVVSVNGVVASLAVTEFMVWASGLRTPWPYLIYRGDQGRVTLSTDKPSPDCYYCKQVGGKAGQAGSSKVGSFSHD